MTATVHANPTFRPVPAAAQRLFDEPSSSARDQKTAPVVDHSVTIERLPVGDHYFVRQDTKHFQLLDVHGGFQALTPEMSSQEHPRARRFADQATAQQVGREHAAESVLGVTVRMEGKRRQVIFRSHPIPQTEAGEPGVTTQRPGAGGATIVSAPDLSAPNRSAPLRPADLQPMTSEEFAAFRHERTTSAVGQDVMAQFHGGKGWKTLLRDDQVDAGAREDRKQYPRAGEKWTEEEQMDTVERIKQGQTLDEASREQGRHPYDIRRVVNLRDPRVAKAAGFPQEMRLYSRKDPAGSPGDGITIIGVSRYLDPRELTDLAVGMAHLGELTANTLSQLNRANDAQFAAGGRALHDWKRPAEPSSRGSLLDTCEVLMALENLEPNAWTRIREALPRGQGRAAG